MVYNSEANSTFGNQEVTRIDSYSTLDLRMGVESQDGSWSITLWGRNVTDEYYWNNQYFTQDVVSRIAAKPATYGIGFTYNL